MSNEKKLFELRKLLYPMAAPYCKKFFNFRFFVNMIAIEKKQLSILF